MRISNQKREKICEQILAHLYTISPKSIFTSDIAKEIARDEEFIKKLLIEMRDKKILTEIKKNSQGNLYLRRSRWRLSDSAYTSYNLKQQTKTSFELS